MYLANDLLHVADSDSRRCLRSSSTNRLLVRRSSLKIGDRVFTVHSLAAAHVWVALPTHVTSVTTLAALKSRLKTLI